MSHLSGCSEILNKNRLFGELVDDSEVVRVEQIDVELRQVHRDRVLIRLDLQTARSG